MRQVLLWAAGNAWLRERVPRTAAARRAVRRFLPGERMEDALTAADGFRRAGIGTLFTRLGENLATLADADAVATHYRGLIDAIADAGLDGQVSVKLTQLGLDLDVEHAFAHTRSLADHAVARGSMLWIDMESSRYVETTVELYARLLAAQPRSGICLQAYLRRTPADIQRLLSSTPAIRLVKGAYAEPADIAFQSRREVDAAYVACSLVLLQARALDPGIEVGLGTHDVRLVELIETQARPLGITRDAFEVQMLYGVRTDEQHRLAAAGYRVRDLIAYGDAWYAWYLRRLAERPANLVFALRQMMPF